MFLVLVGNVVVLVVPTAPYDLAYPFLVGVSSRLDDLRSSRVPGAGNLHVGSLPATSLSFARFARHETASTATSSPADSGLQPVDPPVF